MKDKILHAVVCFFATTICSIVCFFLGEVGSIVSGACFALGLGLGKEYGDSKATGNKWDWKDIVVDLAGIAFAVLVLVIGWHD